MRLSVPTAVLSSLLVAGVAAPAEGAKRLVIRGAGYGHGIGMSQYGTYGFALQGRDYREILRHYYSGTALARLSSSPTVRVLLSTSPRAQVAGVTRVGDVELDPSTTYTLRRGGRGVVVADGDDDLATSQVVRLEPGGGPITIDGRAYRGAAEARPNRSGGLNVVNAVALESYVRGVVSLESPSAWPQQALRAQAVAARTYAITSRAASGTEGFEQFKDTRSQMYGGVAAETPSTDLAVQATAGEVVTFGGRPVTTFFFSTSGGETEDNENSFLGATPQPWLRSVKDPYDDTSPRHRWRLRLTPRQAERKLREYLKGRFRSIRVLERGSSPRVVRAVLVGSRGRTPITGPQLRAELGLYDTWASFTTISAGSKRGRARAGGSPSGGIGPDARAADARGLRVRRVVGTIDPVRPGALIRLQRRTGTKWRTVSIAPVRRNGSYEVAAPEPGRYRVAYGRAVVSPDVKLR